jgi:hypothetical protein
LTWLCSRLRTERKPDGLARLAAQSVLPSDFGRFGRG